MAEQSTEVGADERPARRTRRERLEARAERRREWAGSREAKAEAAHQRVHAIADQIPFGQPILVGHHSEGRTRRDQARIESGMRASIDNARAAQDHAEKAEGIERQLRTSIFSDDVDAVEQLEAKIAGLEAERDRLKAYNASCRRGARDVELLDAKQQASLVSTARVCPYQIGKNGSAPSYWTAGLGAEIRRCRQRVADIQRTESMAASGDRGHGREMLARFSSSCAECGETIEKGSQIIYYRTPREAIHTACKEA